MLLNDSLIVHIIKGSRVRSAQVTLKRATPAAVHEDIVTRLSRLAVPERVQYCMSDKLRPFNTKKYHYNAIDRRVVVTYEESKISAVSYPQRGILVRAT